MSHTVSYDEQSWPYTGAYAIKAFCDCGWAGDWHHADTQPSYDETDGDRLSRATDEACAASAADFAHHRRGARLLAGAARSGLYATDPQEF